MAKHEPSAPLPVAVTAEWLNEHQDLGASVVLADVRWYLDGRSGHAAYVAGHLPDAVFVDMDTDLAGPGTASGGRHPLPDPEEFATALGDLGIGDDTTVIAYDDSGGSTAARLVWMLRVLGSPAALLDGGLQAWTGPLETGQVILRPRKRTPIPWPSDRIADSDTVRAGLGDPAHVLLDARARERYTGESPAPVDPQPGHIPGARSAPWQRNLTDAGHLAAPDVLRQHYTALGADTARSVTAYCGSGVTSCLDLLALERAGFTGTRLYPGSWGAWAATPDLPVETGQAESESTGPGTT
ncbi:thiosulfate/3-mercaptopyruvate sulfurtransferase [Lipingzhangella halophila]|uniref:Thiosulfate/3-mercaptopyruvate sulfurtransferase n=1 Tax=Lipingzhangella halophila TaxID=1783352 RepID=A0A7W7W055_9ACTN|nr:sulfurtransferase [Lipingzhangella halophila]MBB4929547.1 thiosulfate/3-mercaptopyruvate sulfurtransferase [Lipingzhangella halophila]